MEKVNLDLTKEELYRLINNLLAIYVDNPTVASSYLVGDDPLKELGEAIVNDYLIKIVREDLEL